MSPEIDLQAIASRRIVYRVPRECVRRAQSYRAADGTMQPIDLYYPSTAVSGSMLPAVVMITGYPDAGMLRIFGRHAKELGSNVSWAEAMIEFDLLIQWCVTYLLDDVLKGDWTLWRDIASS